ncbi:MAG: hypothetical protein L6Q34_12890 [Nitrospira sp.]|nr:hypothetical protein [Nitrospira sp.]
MVDPVEAEKRAKQHGAAGAAPEREHLSGKREFDVHIFPQVVHLEALLVVGQHGPHDVFIPIILFAENFPDIIGALAVEHIPENTACFVGKAIVDENQVNFAVLDANTGHRSGRLSLIKQENERGLLFCLDARNFFIEVRSFLLSS